MVCGGVRWCAVVEQDGGGTVVPRVGYTEDGAKKS